jgi:CheY-like chemotaxis protein
MAGGAESELSSERSSDAGRPSDGHAEDESYYGSVQRMGDAPRILCVEVTTVDNPVAALALLSRESNFSVVICDLRMPQMDGADFLARVKRIAPASTRLALTACLERQLQPDEVFGILTKPCPLKLLHESVAAAVQHHALMTRPPAVDTIEPTRSLELPPPELDAAILHGVLSREDGVSTFAILAGVAEKLLTLRQGSEAERILRPPLDDILGRCERGQRLSPADSDMAIGLALRLAEVNRAARWIDYVFRLSTALHCALPPGVIERLYALMRQMPGATLGGFREFLPVLRACQDNLTPAEQLVIDRLEGLEPLMRP